MLKLLTFAAILAYANAYFNHGHQPYYGNYGHIAAPAAIAPASIINPHQGNLYNHAYGNVGGLSSHAKIIEATYPGAVHKSASYAVTNPTGYLGSDYGHGPAINYAHQPSAISTPHTALPSPTIPYHQPGPVAIAPAIAYNKASIGNYAHSRYAVTEGPTYAHSRYSISGSPALPYGSAHYPVAIGHGIQKIGYHPVVSHMGYQSHQAQSYAW